MQYYGQLNDLEFRSPVQRIEEPGDIRQLVRAFEELYAKIYYNAARTPEFGYLATRAIMTGSVEVEKPALPHRVGTGPDPDPEAQVGTRDVYWKGSWVATPIFAMDRLHAGNRIVGPAIIEAPACTLIVPPDRWVWLDQNDIFHMRKV